MTLHNQAAGVDLHYPMGRDPTPLDLPDNNATAYKITNAAGTTAYVALDTTTGAIEWVFQAGANLVHVKCKLRTAADQPIQMMESSGDPATLANAGQFYTKDVGGVTELFYRDSEGSVIQLTTNGGLGGRRRTTSVTTTPYTVTAENQTLLVNVAGAVTINLRAAATAGSGAWLEIKDVSGAAATNNITVDGSGAETIDGAATQVIATNYGSLTLVCNGTSWFIL